VRSRTARDPGHPEHEARSARADGHARGPERTRPAGLRAAQALVACLLGLAALGCDEDASSADGGPAVAVDAGALDGGGAGDAGDPDAGGAGDAGSGDAGPSGSCACPTLPPSCTPPEADVPAFTPGADAVAGQLFDVIACADSTLEIAIYEAQWDCVQAALQTALDRDADLTLEIVVDDRECPPGSCFVDALGPDDRVTVVRDDRSGLMHHKFVIADGARLWVGSPNFTSRSLCSDLNDSIVIEEPAIVSRFAAVHDRMFSTATFGPVAPEGATEAGPYTVYFSPESPSSMAPAWLDAMIAAIDAATTSVDVMIFAWTRTELSDAMIAAHARGVEVRAVVAGSYADDAPAQALVAEGIEVRVSSVHSKVMIVDAATVITGSANWSENAWSNNENSLWIADPDVAAAYLGVLDAAFEGGTPVEPVSAP